MQPVIFPTHPIKLVTTLTDIKGGSAQITQGMYAVLINVFRKVSRIAPLSIS